MELTFETKERKLLFRFSTRAWWNIEQQVGSLGKLLERMNGGDRPLDATCILIAETATAGERYAGGKGKITKDYVIDNLTPMQIKNAGAMAKNAVTVGMRREEMDQRDEEIVDAILEEIKAEEAAKKERAARMTDRTSPQGSASDTV
ncbi:MAG: hypothetical protein IJ418_09010 [Clostridia bacterium]|nr:hypothetical protein [Clostridia bacterium]